MDLPKRHQQLLQITVDDINDTYRRGYITAAQRNALFRERGMAITDQLLGDKGYLHAVLDKTIEHLQKGWENFSAPGTKEPGAGNALKGQVLQLWGGVQMLTSVFTAIGEVTGMMAEHYALHAGASPGLARVLNYATDVATGFVPVGTGVKLGVKGTQAVQRGAAKLMKGKPPVTEEGIAEAVRVLNEGLKAEGKPPLTVLGEDIIKALSPIPEGHIRLYRGEPKPGTPGFTTVEPQASEAGRWFSADPVDAAFYSQRAMGDRQVRYVDLPAEEAAKYLTPSGAYKLPKEMAQGGKTAEPPGAAPSPVSEPLSVQDQFVKDMRAFRAQMTALTETQTHEKTRQLADRLGLSLDDLREVVPGAALDEKQMMAYLMALEPAVQRMTELANAATRGGEAELNAFAVHMHELLTVAPIFRGSEVTAGRSVEILKETPPMKKLTDLLMGWDPESMADGKFHLAIRTMAEDIQAMGFAPDKLEAFVAQQQVNWNVERAASVWAGIREAYINLMIARPVSLVRNFLGSSIAASTALAERFTGAVFSADAKKGLVTNEAFYMLKGMHAALADGFKAFASAFSRLPNVDEVTKFDYAVGAIPGWLGSIIRTPGNIARGTDDFFKVLLRRASYYAEAIRDGVHSGREGKQLADFVARRVNFPTKSMVKSGDQFALHNTFQDALGRIAQKIRDVGQVGPLVLWFPFMKTPINLAKYGWDRTPGLQLISGQLYRDIAAGGVKADEAIGRLTLSNLQAMFIYNLSQDGILTGSGPVDQGLRRTWAATHQSYSIKVKDGWVPYSNLEPGSTPIGLVSDYAQIMNQLDETSAEQGAMAAAFATMKGLADKTYWRTLSDIIDVASGLTQGQNIKARARDVLLAPALTATTGGPLVGGIARAIDPIQRETHLLIDSWKSHIPGYSLTVKPVRDAYGDPVLPPQAVGSPWLNLVSPLTMKGVPPDRVKEEGDRLQIKTHPFPWTIGGKVREGFDISQPFPEDRLGVELTPPQKDRWETIYRDLLRNPKLGIEKQLLDNPEYEKQTRAMQREMFQDLLSTYMTTSRDALLLEDTGLAKKLLESQATRIKPLLDRQGQEQVDQQMKQSLELFDASAPDMRENLLRWGVLSQ